jgi:hypothetical protein
MPDLSNSKFHIQGYTIASTSADARDEVKAQAKKLYEFVTEKGDK